MRKIYICSPLKGDIENNIKKATEYCKQAFKEGYIPIAPHIYFPQFADDNCPSHRKICMQVGLEALKHCIAIWVYGEPTEGMKAEIKEAKILGIEVVYKFN